MSTIKKSVSSLRPKDRKKIVGKVKAAIKQAKQTHEVKHISVKAKLKHRGTK